jgi:co-chaperonin GroES (HSP10)
MSAVVPFQPLGSTVVVLPHANTPTQTASGIVLADVYHDAETSGTVIAVGSAFCCEVCEHDRPDPVKVGDRVLFDRGAGMEIDGAPLGLPGDKFLLLQERELLAVLNADAECEVV